MYPRRSHLITLLLATSAIGFNAASAADAKTGIEAWTAFSGAELSASQSGEVQMKSNPSMNFDRGLSAQAIYVVDAKVESAVRALTSLDPTRYPELEVFQQRTFRTEADARFSELKIDPKAAPFDRLLGEMVAPRNLQLANDERGRLPRQKMASAAQEFWAKALRDRWVRFAQEGVTMPVGKFDARSEIRSLLREEPKVAAHFGVLLQPLTSAAGGAAPPASSYYWDISKTEGIANFELGAVFERTEEDRRQIADVTYYSSSGYITAVSLFEFIPLTGRATPQTLVWHGTLLSSAEVAGAFGLKRKFAIRSLEDEMRRWIGIFRRACAEDKK